VLRLNLRRDSVALASRPVADQDFDRCFNEAFYDHALPEFADFPTLRSALECVEGAFTCFLNRASQVRVLPGAPGKSDT
jgi:hypothetical protein